jgi:mannosyltransferase
MANVSPHRSHCGDSGEGVSESERCLLHRHSYLLALVVLAGVLLRGYGLSARSFWFDEAFSWRVIQFPLSEMIERIGRDNHPPLYFILLKAWGAVFGTSPFALRSLSVLFGAVTIVGTYLFIIEAYRRVDKISAKLDERRPAAIALVAAAFVALSVFQIRWAWEVRMYTLGTALGVFSSWEMFRALNASVPSIRTWCVYGLLALLFAYTHYYGLFSIAAQGLFIIGYLSVRRRDNFPLEWRSLLCVACAWAIVLVGFSLWLPVLLSQRSQVQRDFWTTPVTAIDVANVCYQMLVEPENAVYPVTTPIIVSAFCAAVMLVSLWRGQSADWYLFVATVMPFALAIVVSAADTKVFHLRYLLFANIFFFGALAALLARLPYRIERRFVCLWVCGVLLFAYVEFWNKLNISEKPGARACVALLAEKRREGEPVIVCSPLLFFSTLYHATDRSLWYIYNDGNVVVHYEGGAIIRPEDLIFDEDLDKLATARAWVIDMTGWGARRVPVPAEWMLNSEHRFPEVYRVQGDIVLREYSVKHTKKND